MAEHDYPSRLATFGLEDAMSPEEFENRGAYRRIARSLGREARFCWTSMAAVIAYAIVANVLLVAYLLAR
jgi:hypothetical protein